MIHRIGPAKDPTTSPPPKLLQIAKKYRDLGFSLFPIRPDGTKAPAVRTWKHLQTRLPTDSELETWFPPNKIRGIAIIGGAISGNLEILDFDELGHYEKWRVLCADLGLDETVERCAIVRSPSGGYHVYYRCAEPVPGSKTLAQRWEVDKARFVTLDETRGEGGYALAPGSPPACHKDKKPYVLVHGSFAKVPVITRTERNALTRLMETFDESDQAPGSDPHPQPFYGPQPPPPIIGAGSNDPLPTPPLLGGGGPLAGEGLASLLQSAGWECTGYRDGVGYWRRPGKEGPGISATENYGGRGLFRVFSTNAYPFAANHSYKPWEVEALLGPPFFPVPGPQPPTLNGPPAPNNGGAGIPFLPTPVIGGGAGGWGPRAGGPNGAGGWGPSKTLFARMEDTSTILIPEGDPPQLCGRYLVPAASHLLFGTRGIGKSTLIFGLSMAIAKGETWLGIECVQTNVLYIDAESGSFVRAQKIGRLYPEGFVEAGCHYFLSERLRFPEELGELIETSSTHGIGLIVFDTLRRCFAVRDENDNAEFYARVAPVIDALKARGIATLLVAHPPKGIGSSARGAGAQEDAVDVVLSLTMQSGLVTDAAGVVQLAVTKNRILGLGIPPLHLRRMGEDRFERINCDESPARSSQPTKLRLCEIDILRAFRGEQTTTLSYTALFGRLPQGQFSEATFKRTLAQMKKDRTIELTSGGYGLPDPFGPENPYYDELFAEAYPDLAGYDEDE